MRTHPRYLLSKSTPGSKSQGVYLMHTLKPMCIWRVKQDAGQYTLDLCKSETYIHETIEEQRQHAQDWLRANARYVASFFP